MKRVAIGVAVLLLAAAPGWAGGLALMWSYWDTDEARDSDMIGVKLDIEMGSRIDLQLRASWLGDDFGADGQSTLFTMDVFPLEAGFAYNFSPDTNVSPYLGAGLGVYLLGVERPEPQRSATVDDEAGWYAVGGLELGFHEHGALVGEVMWRTLETEIDGDGLDDFDTLGVSFTGVSANLGLQFRW